VRLIWQGLDEPRMEIASVEVEGDGFRATGTQIGVAYELRYELTESLLALDVVGEQTREVPLEADFFDLGSSPLFNSLPVRRDGLHRGGEPRDYRMTWVSVPDLTVTMAEQRYEPLAPGLVCFRSEEFTADLEFDVDGFIVRYPGLAERVF
jgi:hypothetical protein